MKFTRAAMCIAVGAAMTLVVASATAYGNLSPIEELGKKLFFDPNLSTPPGLS